jgi:hypothetical protein
MAEKQNFSEYIDMINQIAENEDLSPEEKVKKIIQAYDTEVKRILYTEQGLNLPEE